MLIVLIFIWMASGIFAYFLQKILDVENLKPMSLFGSILMGVIGFLMVLTQIGRIDDE